MQDLSVCLFDVAELRYSRSVEHFWTILDEPESRTVGVMSALGKVSFRYLCTGIGVPGTAGDQEGKGDKTYQGVCVCVCVCGCTVKPPSNGHNVTGHCVL